MSLTTPENPSFNNRTYTKEGFFLYWNSSRCDWKDLISKNFAQKFLIIPLNWSVHRKNKVIDFGSGSDGKDILKIIQLGNHYNKKVIVAVPITPIPFYENGGIPADLCKNYTYDQSQIMRFNFDEEQKVCLYPSFYDTELFKYFSEFVLCLNLKCVC